MWGGLYSGERESREHHSFYPDRVQFLRVAGSAFWELQRVQQAARNTAHVSGRLMEAVENGDANSTSLLLERKANVNTADKNGFTPLMHAAAGGHSNIVSVLLK